MRCERRRKLHRRIVARFVCSFVALICFASCTKDRSREQAVRGEGLFQMHCAACHEMPPPDLLKEPPKLKGVFNSPTLPSGAPATDEQVRKVILEGLRTMPAFQGRLQDQEVRDLIAYLHTLK
jgi:mono/diheme cytochrome c family protein